MLQRVCGPRRFPRILSVCILAIALLLGFFHIMPSSFSMLFPSCASCVSVLGQFWDIVIQQALRLRLPGQVPKTSLLSPFPWRLPGVCRQTAVPGAQGSMTEQVRRVTQKGKTEAHGEVRQTRCIGFQSGWKP